MDYHIGDAAGPTARIRRLYGSPKRLPPTGEMWGLIHEPGVTGAGLIERILTEPGLGRDTAELIRPWGRSSLDSPALPCGPLDVPSTWRHGVYGAILVSGLIERMPGDCGLRKGVACVAALMQNVGLLFLAGLFPPEFRLINRIASAKPDIPITELERHVLGMGEARHLLNFGHANLGAWLMYEWGMPEEATIAVKQHHCHAYTGTHERYAKLLLTANHLLKRHGIGDAPHAEVPAGVLGNLGLTPEGSANALEEVVRDAPTLDRYAARLVALSAGS